MQQRITDDDSFLLERAIARHSLIVPPQMALGEAIALMIQANSSYAVAIASQPVGILRERDVAKLALTGRTLEGMTVAEVMTQQVVTLKAGEFNVCTAINLLRQHQIEHLQIVDAQNQFLGMLTLHDLLDFLHGKVSQLEAEKVELLRDRHLEQQQQLQEHTTELKKVAERESLLAQVASRIRQSLNLQNILNATVTEVRQLLDCDRVLVYQFAADMSGTIVAESVATGWTAALGTNIQDTCFQRGAGANYLQGRKRAIANIYEAGLSNCHLNLLQQFEVKANLVVPILLQVDSKHAIPHLWGLLIAHQCSSPRQWQVAQLELLDKLAVQIAIAIQQASAFEQARDELAERKQAEAALATSEAKWRSLIQNSSDIVFIKDLDKRIQYVSSSVERVLGYHSEELLSRSWLDFVHPDDVISMTQIFEQLVSQPTEIAIFEYQFLHKDGSWRFLESTGSNFFNDNSVNGIVCNSRDITQRKQAEQQVRFQARLLDAVEQSAIATDLKGDIIYWNRYAEVLYGWSAAEVIGRSAVDILYAETIKSQAGEILSCLQAGESWSGELLVQRRNGITFPVMAIYSPIYDDREKLIGIIGISVDITERKRATEALGRLNQELEARVEQRTTELANTVEQLQKEIEQRQQSEQALQKSEEQYRTLIKNFPSGEAMLFDSDLRYTIADGAGLSETGLSKKLLEGKTIWEVWPPEVCTILEPNYRAALTGTKAIFEMMFRDRLYSVQTFPVKNDQGEIFAGMVLSQNITERKRAEEAMQQQVERERLMGAIAQRIRQSLNLDEILNTTVAEIRQFLQADRSIIYRFESDWSGVVIVESVGNEWTPMLGRKIRDTCLENESCIEPYTKGRIQALGDIHKAGLDKCYVGLLASFEVKANLVVPILQGKNLWGLLVAQHCAAPKDWQPWEIELLASLATQVAIAIQQSELYEQLQVELQRSQEAEETIKASLNEKELLLKEVHHRVKNNLQVISSIFSLQSQYIENKQILSVLADSQNRIGSMALIHEKLYQSNSLAKIDFADYIHTLASNLFSSYNVSPNLIRLKLHVSDVSLNLDTAIPCGLLINELVSNSLKHAFPQQQSGEISINFSVNSDEQVYLVVEDTGVGLPAGLDLQQANSLGLRLVRALTRQLRGKLEVYNSRGCVFQIIFPQSKERKQF